MIGRTLGHYRVVGSLGRGGMGEVYVAEDLRLGRQVALEGHFLQDMRPRQSGASASSAKRAPSRRCRTQHRLDSRIWRARGRAVRRHRTARGADAAGGSRTRSAGDVTGHHLGWGIATGLAAAHARGVIHRDLKPETCSSPRMDVKILDFGLASIERPSEDAAAETVARLTTDTPFSGTVGIWRAEQVKGETATPCTDVSHWLVASRRWSQAAAHSSGEPPSDARRHLLTEAPLITQPGNHRRWRWRARLGGASKRIRASDSSRPGTWPSRWTPSWPVLRSCRTVDLLAHSQPLARSPRFSWGSGCTCLRNRCAGDSVRIDPANRRAAVSESRPC